MHTITKHRTGYLFKRGGVYYLEYMLKGKRVKRVLRDARGAKITERKKAESTRTEIMSPLTVADEHVALTTVLKRLADVPAPPPEKAAPALALPEAWAAYVASQKRPDSGPRTLAAYESQFRLFAAWVAQYHPKCAELRQVTPEIAEAYASYLMRDDLYPKMLRSKKRLLQPHEGETPTPKKAVSPNTFNKHIRLLELVFRVLKKSAQMAENPWSEIGKKVERKQGRRELSIDEINTIVNKAEGELKALLLLGIYTGLRLGDCCTLRWSEVDMTRKIIMRVPNKTARHAGEPVHIPLHPTLASVLAEIRPSKPPEHVLPGFAVRYRKNSSDIAKEMRDHFSKCDIRVHRDGSGRGAGIRAIVEVGFHSLRHSFVSLCRQSNAPLAVVEAIVGHSNPAMTRHYTHVGDLAASAAVAALPTVLGPPNARSLSVTPVPRHPDVTNVHEIRGILDSMTAKNWLSKRADAVRLLDRMESFWKGQADVPTEHGSRLGE
jgi:integrase